ncbi:hypothetical protein SMACR_00410 [Sordaria macrospora]|uniref:WGS project CABT00000000 data, contig 2.1 n=2 Tax=Sordaria macrospora TaxID=5147 RepID=F7VL15_SORMK|nr:uncharacterized protein SMAC_00410 [Sordaria macrospora k-hell]KAA8632635.1 hypothetical protein SMACR_00410 [Sordaria macrospora]KAH7627638.1 hypothetical protein B0T09DRAFT_187613 [Sordaria sp. MPI-SDFR-AT-0083]WPJ59155.1 hypothetical protein SMAC4_00410 [Sordaria macrospora]CCC06192.1 unnamed protein product [Sordaria macrospora k-hell]
MTEGSNAGGDGQITFKVKCSGDKNHTVTIAESATVLQLKTLLAGEEYENIAPEQQRLIYSGKVMKDDELLSTYKIKHMNTVHMVKRPASAATASSGSASTPAQPAIPQNMAAGTPSNNLLAGLTGARFAGQVPLPSRDLFGPDGGMGAPPSEDEMADMLSNPMMAQAMAEAFNNPAVIDQMIASNPMLANMPADRARELLNSPMMRHMMTNPDAIRMAARMRRMMGGGANAFPAPGVTDNTPSAATGAGDNNANANAQNPFAMFTPFGIPPAGAPPAGNPFAALFGNPPGASPATTGASTDSARTGDATSAPGAGATGGSGQQADPLAALFGALGGAGQPGQGGAANPFDLPPISPEALQQMMQAFGGGGLGGMGGMGGFGGSPAAPPDNRPPEERYAEQLRQLNDMGFFDFDQNVAALRRSGGSVQGAIEHLLGGS